MQEQNKSKGKRNEEENEVDFFSFSVGGSKEDSKSTAKKNAEVMQRLLKLYIKVSFHYF